MIDLTALCQRIDVLALCPDVKPAGRDKYRGRCPLCAGSGLAISMHRKGYLTFHCFSCATKGSPLDLYAKLNGISIGEAIKRLDTGGIPVITDEERTCRMSDAARASEGTYVLACDWPCCESVKEVATALDAAVLASGSSWQWAVSPNQQVALCVEHRL